MDAQIPRAGRCPIHANSSQANAKPSDDEDDGLERFISATRRQNFLIPPRRHRSFPLLELS